ncbi:MAG: ABC transporter permease subunit, partial [Gemmiger sp.]|nr:ABC transporter permease subunit [Gemmiger sp.]
MKTNALKENAMRAVFTVSACISILAVALICIFLFANGLPAIFEIGPLSFLLGKQWKPSSEIFGILPMILGSIYVTAGALVVGVPIGLLTALFMSRFATKKTNRVLLPAVQLLAGIPSVVYGFFGMMVLVPFIEPFARRFNGKGQSLFTASLLLGIMILPTIITVSKTSLDAVPESYYEGS